MAETLYFPHDLTSGGRELGNFVKFEFFEHNANLSPYVVPLSNESLTESIDNDVIYLPMSQEAFKTAVSASQIGERLDFVGDLIYDSVRETNGTIDGIKKVLGQALDLEKVVDGTASYFAAQALQVNAGFVSGIKFAEGVAYNPNIRVLYDGMAQDYRSFLFSWKLFPSNEAEMETIQKIIRTFTKHLLPATFGTATSALDNYKNHYKYPKKVRVTFYVGNSVFNKFKIATSVIRSMQVSHSIPNSPDEVPFHVANDKLSYPFNYMTVYLTETNIFTREDVKRSLGRESVSSDGATDIDATLDGTSSSIA